MVRSLVKVAQCGDKIYVPFPNSFLLLTTLFLGSGRLTALSPVEQHWNRFVVMLRTHLYPAGQDVEPVLLHCTGVPVDGNSSATPEGHPWEVENAEQQ